MDINMNNYNTFQTEGLLQDSASLILSGNNNNSTMNMPLLHNNNDNSSNNNNNDSNTSFAQYDNSNNICTNVVVNTTHTLSNDNTNKNNSTPVLSQDNCMYINNIVISSENNSMQTINACNNSSYNASAQNQSLNNTNSNTDDPVHANIININDVQNSSIIFDQNQTFDNDNTVQNNTNIETVCNNVNTCNETNQTIISDNIQLQLQPNNSNIKTTEVNFLSQENNNNNNNNSSNNTSTDNINLTHNINNNNNVILQSIHCNTSDALLQPSRNTVKRKLTSKSLEIKVEALNKIRNGAKKSEVAKEVGVPANTLTGWVKNEDKIRHACEVLNKNAKKIKRSKYPEVDQALQQWFDQMIAQGQQVSGLQLQEQANIFMKQFGHGNDTMICKSWVDRWKYRKGLIKKRSQNNNNQQQQQQQVEQQQSQQHQQVIPVHEHQITIHEHQIPIHQQQIAIHEPQIVVNEHQIPISENQIIINQQLIPIPEQIIVDQNQMVINQNQNGQNVVQGNDIIGQGQEQIIRQEDQQQQQIISQTPIPSTPSLKQCQGAFEVVEQFLLLSQHAQPEQFQALYQLQNEVQEMYRKSNIQENQNDDNKNQQGGNLI